MKLSIVTICRNDAAGLARTLESTFAGQAAVDDWEQVVVDGASTDGSFAVLDKWKDDPRLGWHVSEPDKGIYHAMNKGAAHARGDWLLFLNAGDSLLPDVLRKVLPQLVNPDEVVHGDVIRLLGTETCPYQILEDADISREMFLFTNIQHQATFVPTILHESRGGYDETLSIISDWKFWLHCAVDGIRFRHIPIQVSEIQVGGLSTDPKWEQRMREEKYSVFEPVFGKAVARRAAFPPENKPWIRGPVAEAALHDPSLARCLRRSNDVLAGLWRCPPFRFLLRGLTAIAEFAVQLGKRIQSKQRKERP